MTETRPYSFNRQWHAGKVQDDSIANLSRPHLRSRNCKKDILQGSNRLELNQKGSFHQQI